MTAARIVAGKCSGGLTEHRNTVDDLEFPAESNVAAITGVISAKQEGPLKKGSPALRTLRKRYTVIVKKSGSATATATRTRNTSLDPIVTGSKPNVSAISEPKTVPLRDVVASVALADELRESLGEDRFASILQTIREAIRDPRGKLDARQSEIEDLRLRNTARTESKRTAILKDAVNSDVAGQFISRSRPVVLRLAKRGELLAVEDGRFFRFPRWQFDERSEDGLVPGLRRVLAIMDASPLRKAAWLVSPNPRLKGRTPIDLLREGKLDRVYEEATGVISG